MAQKIQSFFTQLAKNVLSFLKLLPTKIKARLNIMLSWVKERPTEVREWKKADKKKKKYRSFHLQKKIKPEPRFIPGVLQLLKFSLKFLWSNKRILLTIMAIHAIAYYMFAKGPQTINIETIQNSVRETFGAQSTGLSANIATVGGVLGLTGGGSQNNAVAVTVMMFGVSLVYVWAIRKITAGESFKARDAFYQGLGPIIPVLMVLILISIQLIPFAAASFVYTSARTSGLFATGAEDMGVFIVAALFALLSFYLMTSTVIALYVATLPGMRPLGALRAAKKLVQFQRLAVFKRIIGLPIVLGLVYLLVLFILVRFMPSKALFFAEVFQIIILPLVHIYLYKLYRALI